MKILFINQRGLYVLPSLGYGLGIVATIASRAGHQVHVIDNNSNYKYYYDHELIKLIASYQPKVVALGINLFNACFTYELMAKLKKRFPNLILLGGGIHMRHSFQEALDHGIDIVVNDEAELIIEPLLSFLEDKTAVNCKSDLGSIPGVSFYNDDGQLQSADQFPKIDNLDTVPFVDYNLFNLKDFYRHNNELGLISICGQRGCPYQCKFCSDNNLRSDRRISSAEYLSENAKYVYREFHQRFIKISDNNFILPKKRALSFCENIAGSELHKNVNFSIQTNINTSLGEDVVMKLVDAGIVTLNIGIERMDKESRQLVSKNIVDTKLFGFLNLMKHLNQERRLRLGIVINFLVGFPFENLETLEKEKQAITELIGKYDIGISLAALDPVPGTTYYDNYPKARQWYLEKERYQKTRTYFATVFRSAPTIPIDRNFFDLDKPVVMRLRALFDDVMATLLQKYPRRKMRFKQRLYQRIDKLIGTVSKAVYFISPALELYLFQKPKAVKHYINTSKEAKSLNLR